VRDRCTAAGVIKRALLLDGQEELELRWELLFAVEAVREVDAADAAVGMDLDTQGLNVVGTCTGARGDMST
jgi:hypothetical protein